MNAGANCKSSKHVNLAIWGTPLQRGVDARMQLSASINKEEEARGRGSGKGVRAWRKEEELKSNLFRTGGRSGGRRRGRLLACWDIVDAGRADGMQLMDDDDTWMGGWVDGWTRLNLMDRPAEVTSLGKP